MKKPKDGNMLTNMLEISGKSMSKIVSNYCYLLLF